MAEAITEYLLLAQSKTTRNAALNKQYNEAVDVLYRKIRKLNKRGV